MLDGLIVILCCQLAGELLVAVTSLPVPGPVAGMAILLVGLMVRGTIPKDVPNNLAVTGDTLIRHLALLFVPAGVGVMLHANLIAREWLAIGSALVVSTLLGVAITGLVMARLAGPPEPSSEPRP